MSRKRITLSPYGCASCVHAWVDRCSLTGHRMRYAVNAPHHCQAFRRTEGVGGAPDRLASHAIRTRTAMKQETGSSPHAASLSRDGPSS
jgi:hypothetical protein